MCTNGNTRYSRLLWRMTRYLNYPTCFSLGLFSDTTGTMLILFYQSEGPLQKPTSICLRGLRFSPVTWCWLEVKVTLRFQAGVDITQGWNWNDLWWISSQYEPSTTEHARDAIAIPQPAPPWGCGSLRSWLWPRSTQQLACHWTPHCHQH